MARHNISLLLSACIPLLTVAVTPSAGCRAGGFPPIAPGGTKRFSMQSPDATQLGGNATRWYWLNIPNTYEPAKPAMLVFVFHGFYDNGHKEMWEDSIPTFVNENRKNVVSVYPIGSYDGGDSASWNVEGGGLNLKPGPLGPICGTPRRGSQMYTCYDSCTKSEAGCNPHLGCDASSCMDDRGFIKRLLTSITESVCIDLDAVHLTGISMGGQMVLQTALDLAPQIASIAPVAGARYWGYMRSPPSPVAILDVHGRRDHTIPANTTTFQGPAGAAVSSDYFYYHPTPHHLNAFAGANGCSNKSNLPYPTAYDGIRDLACNQPHGECSLGSVVQCVGDWGHTWPLYKTHPLAYAELALSFFETHARTRTRHDHDHDSMTE